MDHDHHQGERAPRRANIVLVGFILIAGFYLVTEHTAHVFGALPFLLLLACPLMHVFMHGGHGHSHEAQGDKTSQDRQP